MKIGRWRWYLAGVVAAVVLYWLIKESRRNPWKRARERSAEAVRPAIEAARPAVAVETERVEDDLSQIKGIGPVRVTRLREAGISSFAALGRTSTEQLKALFPRVGMPALERWKAQASERSG